MLNQVFIPSCCSLLLMFRAESAPETSRKASGELGGPLRPFAHMASVAPEHLLAGKARNAHLLAAVVWQELCYISSSNPHSDLAW